MKESTLKVLRTNGSRRSLAALLSVSLLATGCVETVEPAAQQESSDRVSARLSGEDWFRGLFFAQGPAAEVYTPLQENVEQLDPLEREKVFTEVGKTVEEAKDEHALADRLENHEDSRAVKVVADTLKNSSPEGLTLQEFEDVFFGLLEEEHPDFLQAFEQDMESGHHVRVQNAFQNASKIMVDVLGKINAEGLSIRPTDVQPLPPPICYLAVLVLEGVGVVHVAAVATTVVAAAAVAVWAAYWAWGDVSEATVTGSLFRDQLVNEIVKLSEQ